LRNWFGDVGGEGIERGRREAAAGYGTEEAGGLEGEAEGEYLVGGGDGC